MAPFSEDFGPFDGHVWLNCAHQGPLPKPSVRQAELALAQKVAPYRLPYESFEGVPSRLKTALASVIGCKPDEVILGNSTSYGLNLLAQGLPLKNGDEVLLVDGDFPASVITWLPLRQKGVEIRLLRPTTWPPSPQEISDALTSRTRVFCCSWVFSFFGSAIDVDTIGRICRERDVVFVLNGSQAIGARAIDVSVTPIDCLVGCGFKWLCGPYGTGFAWFRPDVLDSLTYDQAYWLVHSSPSPDYELREGVGAARYDVFGTANFLNFMTWTASVEYVSDKGLGRIQEYDDGLVQHAVDGLASAGYRLISPSHGPHRSTLVLFSHRDVSRNPDTHGRLREEGIHIEQRDEKLRMSPHFYNTPDDIDRALAMLSELA